MWLGREVSALCLPTDAPLSFGTRKEVFLIAEHW